MIYLASITGCQRSRLELSHWSVLLFPITDSHTASNDIFASNSENISHRLICLLKDVRLAWITFSAHALNDEVII